MGIGEARNKKEKEGGSPTHMDCEASQKGE